MPGNFSRVDRTTLPFGGPRVSGEGGDGWAFFIVGGGGGMCALKTWKQACRLCEGWGWGWGAADGMPSVTWLATLAGLAPPYSLYQLSAGYIRV